MTTAVLGGGALGRLVLNILKRRGEHDFVVYDDEISATESIGDAPVEGSIDEALREKRADEIIIAIGDVETRRQLFDQFASAGFDFRNAIHPSASIASTASIGDGVIVKEEAVIEPDAAVDDNCIIGNGTIVCHDVTLGPHVRLAPSVTIAGHAKVGERTYLCPGVNVDRDRSIGEGTTVASGCTIWNDVPPDSTVKLPEEMVIHDK